jgi:hypothetical protein
MTVKPALTASSSFMVNQLDFRQPAGLQRIVSAIMSLQPLVLGTVFMGVP